MVIKAGRKEYDLNENDRILFNGACYQLITRELRIGFDKNTPIISKTLMKKLIKESKIVLCQEKYKTPRGTEMDLYKIANSDC